MIRRFTTLALLLGMAALGCDSGPAVGEVEFDLLTPNTDDGAVQFTVTAAEGQTLTAVAAACGGCQVFAQSSGDREIRGVLVGDIAPGPVLLVTVSDVKSKQAYSATVDAVAARDFSVRDPGGYSLSIR